eukprot:TRINITY_DN10959_c0_g1_i1.p1 TRINITY_DN10959_c0_g1~~TRINITY_DN10959_c0_g1_i1.p1  ORF type:complete len:100 (-),score=8.88 TRINITY_DN10959_c0_g1_i1:153-452(-)
MNTPTSTKRCRDGVGKRNSFEDNKRLCTQSTEEGFGAFEFPPVLFYIPKSSQIQQEKETRTVGGSNPEHTNSYYLESNKLLANLHQTRLSRSTQSTQRR